MRDFVLELLRIYGADGARKLVGVELGVYDATNAKETLKTLKPSKLYLIDPYLKYDGYEDYGGHSQEYWDNLCVTTMSYFNIKYPESRIGSRDGVNFEFIRSKSEDAVNMFQDESLDFVYIDANHRYEYVKQDINLWYPKVKHSGNVMGHDLLYPHVEKAVRECSEFYDSTYKFGQTHTEWWFRKK